MKTKIGVALLLIGILISTSCKKEETPPEEKVSAVLLLGAPVPDPDFQSNGRVTMNIVSLSEAGTVIPLGVGDIQIVVDSSFSATISSFTAKEGSHIYSVKKYAKGSNILQTYHATVISVDFRSPSQDKVAVAMLFDSSGSMSYNDPNMQRVDAGKEFILNLLDMNRNSLVGIFDFAARYGDLNNDGIDDYYMRVLQDFTQVTDTIALFGALDSLTANGGTPLYLSSCYTIEHLASTIDSTQYARVLLGLTDGEDNESYPVTADTVIAYALNHGIKVFYIGLGDTTTLDYQALQRIAQNTGGLAVGVNDPNGLAQIFQALGYGISGGYNEVKVEFSPIPATGTLLYGRIIVTHGGQTREASWSFVSP